MKSGQAWNNEAALKKFAAQFQLSSDEIKTVEEVKKEQNSELQNKGRRWYLRPLKFLG